MLHSGCAVYSRYASQQVKSCTGNMGRLTSGAPKGDLISCGAGLACVGCVNLCLSVTAASSAGAGMPRRLRWVLLRLRSLQVVNQFANQKSEGQQELSKLDGTLLTKMICWQPAKQGTPESKSQQPYSKNTKEKLRSLQIRVSFTLALDVSFSSGNLQCNTVQQ